MRRRTLLSFVGFSLLAAVVLSLLSFLALHELNEFSTRPRREAFAVALAAEFESRPYVEAMRDYATSHHGRGARTQMWIVDDAGHVLATNSEEALPDAWFSLEKPEGPHDVVAKQNWFSSAPEITAVRLQDEDATAPAYLVTRLSGRRQNRSPWLAPLALTFILVGAAVFIALLLTFYYLHGKSREAKEVLAALEKGDLKARFRIERIDEVGSVMLDFNRMASEIERLVNRLQETERARRSLLQELSHDLRTPLTSLSASVETLQNHFEQLSVADRQEFFGMIEGELRYFVRLVEDLFFIADLDEPRYKASATRLDLVEPLAAEVRARQNLNTDGERHWQFKNETPHGAFMLGDPHLILRLFKNALDNAARFAKTTVTVTLRTENHVHFIVIEDDGPGLDPAALEAFGQRRANRGRVIRREPGSREHLSLGLGSVIMKSIAEIHEGQIEMRNRARGARLEIRLPQS